jgi:membrane protein implicated in regulation of membrane protease activity
MPDWAIWLVVAAALLGVEMFTLTFLFGPLSLAAAIAAVVALAGAGVSLQLLAFVAAGIASLGLLRPIARSHLRVPAQIRTGTAALVGASAVVLERVDGSGGQVRLGGEVWSARSFDESRVFDPGERVSVLEIQGATALVSD